MKAKESFSALAQHEADARLITEKVKAFKASIGEAIDEETQKLIAEYEESASRKISNAIKERIAIENRIAKIKNPAMRQILERRYLLHQPWEGHYDRITGEYISGITDHMNYSLRQLYRLHGYALIAFEKTE